MWVGHHVSAATLVTLIGFAAQLLEWAGWLFTTNAACCILTCSFPPAVKSRRDGPWIIVTISEHHRALSERELIRLAIEMGFVQHA